MTQQLSLLDQKPLAPAQQEVRLCSIDGCENVHYGRGWCRMHYCRWQAHGDPLAKVWPIPAEERFWSRVDKRPSDGCWLWTAGRNANGYGLFQAHEGDSKLAHRWSYEDAYGAIPDGLVLDHLCRTPACVRPDHLEAVTQGENARRGLVGRRKTHCANGHEFTPENTYTAPAGNRHCRTCQREHGAAYRMRRAER